MFECLICDSRFHEYNVEVDEFGGKKAVCPYCHGDIEDLYKCKVCGEYHTDDDLQGGVCMHCIDKHTNLKNCLEFGDDCKVNVKVNGFIAYVLTSSQINEILVREINKSNEIIPIDSSDLFEFVASDPSWFGEKILKKERTICQ